MAEDDGTTMCDEWFDLPWLATEGDDDEHEWFDWPTASCRLPEGHEGKHEMVLDTNEIRDHIADFDDFFRPIRNYFYWEPHCFDIPVC